MRKNGYKLLTVASGVRILRKRDTHVEQGYVERVLEGNRHDKGTLRRLNGRINEDITHALKNIDLRRRGIPLRSRSHGERPQAHPVYFLGQYNGSIPTLEELKVHYCLLNMHGMSDGAIHLWTILTPEQIKQKKGGQVPKSAEKPRLIITVEEFMERR